MREVPTFDGMVEGYQAAPPPGDVPKKKPGWKRDLPPKSEVDEIIEEGVNRSEASLKRQIEKDANPNSPETTKPAS